jgi:ribosomal subunit interface protein
MEIRGRNLWLTPALLDHVERRVHGALGRHGERIRRVTVRLFDRNGDHGGPDKQCRIVVQTAAPGGAVVVDDVDEDLYAAVSRAAARASEGLRRRLERRRSGRPSTGRGRSRDEPPGGRAHDAPVPRRELERELRGADRITEQPHRCPRELTRGPLPL